jgi:hypothetical protein
MHKETENLGAREHVVERVSFVTRKTKELSFIDKEMRMRNVCVRKIGCKLGMSHECSVNSVT